MVWVATLLLALSPRLAAAANETHPGVPNADFETLVLGVTLNAETKGDLFVQRTAESDFLVKVEDLKAIGLKDPVGSATAVDGEAYLSLRSMRALSFEFDPKALVLHITADPSLLGRKVIPLASQRRRATDAARMNSAFFNYAFTATTGSTASSSGVHFSGEAGVRWGDYLLLADATQVDKGAGKRLVRLMTSITRDDPETLRRTVVGDYLTQSRDFTTSVNLGGLSIAKLYGLDPTFARFAAQSLSGTVALPSDLDVYLDGQRIRTERVRPGAFELRDILAYGGSQDVQVVLRDPFGRTQQLSYSLYFSDQALGQGLHEYSYSAGAFRRGFGLESAKYGAPAFTMFHRYGFSNTVTIGWRADATRHFVNTGPTLSIVAGTLGVVNLGLAASSVDGHRATAKLGSYTYQSRKWSIGLFARHDGAGYATLGDPPYMTSRRWEGSASVGYRLPGNGLVTLSHTALTTRTPVAGAAPSQRVLLMPLDSRRATTFAYSTPFASARAQLTASISHVRSAHGPGHNEVFVGASLLLGTDYGAALSRRADGGTLTQNVRLNKNQPMGEGLGFTLSLDRYRGDTESGQFASNVQYNAPAAVLRYDLGQYLFQGRRTEDHRASIAGAVLMVGNQVALSRPVTESFALVKVGTLRGVEVLMNNQPVAQTDREGLAVVPTLSSYHESTISIRPDAVPIEYALARRAKSIAPAFRSGTFVDFGATKTQAFSGKLFSELNGITRPIEFHDMALTVSGKRQTLPTGRGGEFYLENVQPGAYSGVVPVDGRECLFTLTIPQSDQTFVELGDTTCRVAP